MFEVVRVRKTVFVGRFFGCDFVRESVFGVEKFGFEFIFSHSSDVTPGDAVFFDVLVESLGVGPWDQGGCVRVRFGARAGIRSQARNIRRDVNRQWIRMCGTAPTSIKNVRRKTNRTFVNKICEFNHDFWCFRVS